MVYKKIVGNELYVYMNGELLYKRWLNQGHGMIFGCKVYIQPFRASDVFVKLE